MLLLQMMETKVENPWDVKSIYEFYHFNCPTCLYKHSSKQDFVNHVANIYPELMDHFVILKLHEKVVNLSVIILW